jgi:hypothetical protein
MLNRTIDNVSMTTTRRGSLWIWRRWLAGLALGICILWASSSAWSAWMGYVGYLRYEPQEGDVVFQSLPHGPVVWAIEGVTRSPYSHCGIVAKQGDHWVVYEAYRGVSATPLKRFLLRGRGGGFAVYRLDSEYRSHVTATLACCQTYLGRPYDIRYRLDEEKIYCSELIYKAFRDATGGQQLGALSRFGDMHWQPYEALIRQIEGGDVPLDRKMITPVGLAQASQLKPVFSHRLPFAASPANPVQPAFGQ